MLNKILLLILLCSTCIAIADAPQDIEVTTANGEKVILHPNGRWEYVDVKKAEVAKAVANTYPENQTCPKGAQGASFGFGRCILPGDKDYNRGTLNPRTH